MSEGGYAAVTIGALARRAGVSRAAFYEHYENKEACLLAAYERFARGLVEAMTGEVREDTPWSEFIVQAIDGYLGTLQADLVASRAFLLGMDAAGPGPRGRRRQEMHAFATLLAARHAAIIERESSLAPLPARAYLGLVLGVRELVCEVLEEQREPDLVGLAPDIMVWITAMIEGARRSR
jgi:AcrR family transcriptional regulator